MKNLKKLTLFIALIALISCNKPYNGYELIKKMKEQYNNSFYTNFTFSQKVTNYKNDSIINETVWHEAYSYPGQLIIKYDSFGSGSGVIYNNDSVYNFRANELISKQRKINDLVLIGYDIYELPVDLTCDKLQELGYDISKLCLSSVNDKPAYCVGVESETDRQNKFYIDKETLCFVKLVKYSNETIVEIDFENYKIINNKPVATEVVFYKNNKLVMKENYYNIKFPSVIEYKIFDPKSFAMAFW